MKKIVLFIAVSLFTVSSMFAGTKFKSALIESQYERYSSYVKRLEALATILYYKAAEIKGTLQNADTKIDEISKKEHLIGIPEEIQEELSSISSPTNRSANQLAKLESYYQQVLNKLAPRMYESTKELPAHIN